MSQVPSSNNLTALTSQQSTQSNAFNNLDVDEFLQLMIAELQNQDPLNPLDNNDLLQQISQIREVTATDRMTTTLDEMISTLDAVLLGQNVTTATTLLGQEIEGFNEAGDVVRGAVDRITFSQGTPTLHVGNQRLPLNTVYDITRMEESGGVIDLTDETIDNTTGDSTEEPTG